MSVWDRQIGLSDGAVYNRNLWDCVCDCLNSKYRRHSLYSCIKRLLRKSKSLCVLQLKQRQCIAVTLPVLGTNTVSSICRLWVVTCSAAASKTEGVYLVPAATPSKSVFRLSKDGMLPYNTARSKEQETPASTNTTKEGLLLISMIGTKRCPGWHVLINPEQQKHIGWPEMTMFHYCLKKSVIIFSKPQWLIYEFNWWILKFTDLKLNSLMDWYFCGATVWRLTSLPLKCKTAASAFFKTHHLSHRKINNGTA